MSVQGFGKAPRSKSNGKQRGLPYSRPQNKRSRHRVEYEEEENEGFIGKMKNFVATWFTFGNDQQVDSESEYEGNEIALDGKTEAPSHAGSPTNDAVTSFLQVLPKNMSRDQIQQINQALNERVDDKVKSTGPLAAATPFQQNTRPPHIAVTSPTGLYPPTPGVVKPTPLHGPNTTPYQIVRTFTGGRSPKKTPLSNDRSTSQYDSFHAPSTSQTPFSQHQRYPPKRPYPLSPIMNGHEESEPIKQNDLSHSRDYRSNEKDLVFLDRQPPLKQRKYRDGYSAPMGASQTAKRIMDAISQFSTPLSDARGGRLPSMGRESRMTPSRRLSGNTARKVERGKIQHPKMSIPTDSITTPVPKPKREGVPFVHKPKRNEFYQEEYFDGESEEEFSFGEEEEEIELSKPKRKTSKLPSRAIRTKRKQRGAEYQDEIATLEEEEERPPSRDFSNIPPFTSQSAITFGEDSTSSDGYTFGTSTKSPISFDLTEDAEEEEEEAPIEKTAAEPPAAQPSAPTDFFKEISNGPSPFTTGKSSFFNDEKKDETPKLSFFTSTTTEEDDEITTKKKKRSFEEDDDKETEKPQMSFFSFEKKDKEPEKPAFSFGENKEQKAITFPFGETKEKEKEKEEKKEDEKKDEEKKEDEKKEDEKKEDEKKEDEKKDEEKKDEAPKPSAGFTLPSFGSPSVGKAEEKTAAPTSSWANFTPVDVPVTEEFAPCDDDDEPEEKEETKPSSPVKGFSFDFKPTPKVEEKKEETKTDATEEKKETPSFTFTSTPSSTPATPSSDTSTTSSSVAFGSSTPTFSFGSNATTPNVSTGFTFGSSTPATETKPEVSFPAQTSEKNNDSMADEPSAPFTAASSSGFPFGGQSTTTFGSSTTTFGSESSSTSSGFTFTSSSGTSSPAPAFGGFGASTSSAPAADSSSSSSGFVFGSSTAASSPAPAFGGFGASASQETSAPFGAAPSTGSFGFGNSTSTPAFGASAAAPAFGSSTTFGSPATPAFGASTPAFETPTPAPAFGASTPAFGNGFNAASSPFGAANSQPSFGAAPSPGGFSFGAPAPESSSMPTGDFVFGSNQSAPATPTFPSQQQNAFGQAPPANFGSPAPFGDQSGFAPSQFGAPAQGGAFTIGAGDTGGRKKLKGRRTRK